MPNPVVSVSNSASPMPLLSDEQVIFRSRPHFIIPFSLIILILGAGAILFFLLSKVNIFIIPQNWILLIESLVFLLVAFIVFLYWILTEYILTTQRVEWRFGIIGKGVISIGLEKIQNIALSISILGRIFNFGSIKIEPAGISADINFNGIPNPTNKKEEIENRL